VPIIVRAKHTDELQECVQAAKSLLKRATSPDTLSEIGLNEPFLLLVRFVEVGIKILAKRGGNG